MVYITVKQSPMYHQMTLEELLNDSCGPAIALNPNLTNTKTYEVENVSEYMARKLRFNIPGLIVRLQQFNAMTEYLRAVPRHDLYREFKIPKKSGGWREISAPEPQLMEALRSLKDIFENDFRALYHTSAFAYIRKRSTLDAMKRHQANESRWYAKYDLHNFFGSTTLDFIMKMFSMIYPFSEVVKSEEGYNELRKALELAILDGGLPQGTPISPMITNIMMIPVDYKLSNKLRSYERQNFVYTRYADDFQISSRYDFNFRKIESVIRQVLASFDAPFTINHKKTRYGSSSGRNFNLGLMLCKDTAGKVQITVGHEKKRLFRAKLTSFILDTKNGNPWDIHDIQVLDGYRNYLHMIEPEATAKIIQKAGEKYNVNVIRLIRSQLNA